MTYPIHLPDHKFARITLKPMSATAKMQSQFSYSQDVYAFGGQAWGADVTITTRTHEAFRQWENFILRLNGLEGTFLLGDPTKAISLGSAKTNAGTPQINGAQDARQISIAIKTGLGATTGYLLAGDHIQLGANAGARLHQVLEDVNLNASGHGMVYIWPHTRTSYVDDAPVIISEARGVFRLDDTADLPKYPVVADLSFSCTEAL